MPSSGQACVRTPAQRGTLLADRTNREWISDLRETGPGQSEAIAELRTLLTRGLGYALTNYHNVTTADIEDFVQDALLKILQSLSSFRGESRFTTWAQKIAVHVAFTEMRRRRWRDVSLDQATTLPDGDQLPRNWVDPSASTEQQAVQHEVLDVIHKVITEELTHKQRQAFVAVRLQDMPISQVADLMTMNQNALYKLLFDARKKLQRRLAAYGLSTQEIISAFDIDPS